MRKSLMFSPDQMYRVIRRGGGCCEVCRVSMDEEKMVIHHIDHNSTNNRFSPHLCHTHNNLLFLCVSCHARITGLHRIGKLDYYRGLRCGIYGYIYPNYKYSSLSLRQRREFDWEEPRAILVTKDLKLLY